MADPPAWLAELRSTQPTDRTRVGIGLCVTDATIPLTHAGLVHWEPGEEPYVLHLAFHAIVRDEPIGKLALDLFWSELPLDDDGAAAVAGYCRRIGKRPPFVRYGIAYEGGTLAEDGTAVLGGSAVGLTCATYVLALLRSFNHDIIVLDTWPPRADDDPWHAHILKMLIGFHCKNKDVLSPEHIVAVSRERGCARYRPEEVAAAAGVQWPSPFDVAEPRGRDARAALVARAKATGT